MTVPKKLAKPIEWPDDPRRGHLIDDNALYVLVLIARGMLAHAGSDNFFALTARTPIEWKQKDMFAFILRMAEAYSFELTNISVMTYAFEEEYELPNVDNKGRVDPAYEKAWELRRMSMTKNCKS